MIKYISIKFSVNKGNICKNSTFRLCPAGISGIANYLKKKLFFSFLLVIQTTTKKLFKKKLDGIAASVKDSLRWNTSTSQKPRNYIVLNFGFQRRGNFLGSSVDH